MSTVELKKERMDQAGEIDPQYIDRREVGPDRRAATQYTGLADQLIRKLVSNLLKNDQHETEKVISQMVDYVFVVPSENKNESNKK